MIVDDSAVVRETLKQILEEEGSFEVVATASDPLVAARKLQSVVPDVITLDIEMPRMDGLSFLQKLMHQHPIPVVVCSSMAERGSGNALKALDYGAVDIIEKPKAGTKAWIEESKVRIGDAIRAAKAAKVDKLPGVSKSAPGTGSKQAPPPPAGLRQVQPKLNADAVLSRGTKRDYAIETTDRIVVVGASTGGTEALKTFLDALPLDAPGVVVVQHMPENFTRAFAERLNSICEVTVKEAQSNDSVIRGHVLIAPGNKHILLKRSGARYYVEVRDGPLVSRHRPSVEVLFRSAARYAGKNAVGIIMTGMGDDGARGMEEMKEAGAYNIAQDEATSVVFGMPNEAIKRNAVDKVLPLDRIAGHMLSLVK
ncbi:MAG: protein-glutamate methylesterase/protein-glutamine glutaminase [Alkalispirochaetaceae bacterium]